jgi:lysophospholipase L1-like esterase
MKIEKGNRLVFIGDSITDCGRSRPIGEGFFDALGTGYVSLVAGHLMAFHPQEHIRVINVGTSGNTVRDLWARWQTDVVDLAPDWLSVMIGINDVWRQFDTPLQSEWGVPLDEYERTLEELVRVTRPHLKGLVMMTPYLIEPNAAEPMRAKMDQYGAVVKKVAQQVDAICVDTQAAFNHVLEHIHPMTLAWDRVHPNVAGHLILAKAFLDAVK